MAEDWTGLTIFPLALVDALPAEEKDVLTRTVLVEGLETVEDLAFLYCGESEAEASGLLQAWRLAREYASSGPAKFAEVLHALRVRREAERAPRASVPVRLTHLGKVVQVRTVQPPRTAGTTRISQDMQRRLEAAAAAVALSVSWAPRAGLAAALPEAHWKLLVEEGSPAIA